MDFFNGRSFHTFAHEPLYLRLTPGWHPVWRGRFEDVYIALVTSVALKGNLFPGTAEASAAHVRGIGLRLG